MKNLCGKMVKKENAYEVWTNNQSFALGTVLPQAFLPNTWTWYVLKKYQSTDNERKNPYARWHCFVTSPIVPDGEYGDVYIKDITDVAIRIK